MGLAGGSDKAAAQLGRAGCTGKEEEPPVSDGAGAAEVSLPPPGLAFLPGSFPSSHPALPSCCSLPCGPVQGVSAEQEVCSAGAGGWGLEAAE